MYALLSNWYTALMIRSVNLCIWKLGRGSHRPQLNSLYCPKSKPKYNFSYTFINGLNHTSMIDHFCVSSRTHDKLINLSIIDEGDNLFDHRPLVINFLFNFNFDKTSTSNVHENINKIKFRWKEASCEYNDNFRYTLDWLLKDIEIPFDALNCKNIPCFSHSEILIISVMIFLRLWN